MRGRHRIPGGIRRHGPLGGRVRVGPAGGRRPGEGSQHPGRGGARWILLGENKGDGAPPHRHEINDGAPPRLPQHRARGRAGSRAAAPKDGILHLRWGLGVATKCLTDPHCFVFLKNDGKSGLCHSRQETPNHQNRNRKHRTAESNRS